MLRVPVTMGTDAKLGSKQPVALDLQFDIFDGTSAQVVGRFIERVTTKIEVGQYIDPPVAGRSAPQPSASGWPCTSRREGCCLRAAPSLPTTAARAAAVAAMVAAAPRCRRCPWRVV